jgi:hypothetical protein
MKDTLKPLFLWRYTSMKRETKLVLARGEQVVGLAASLAAVCVPMDNSTQRVVALTGFCLNVHGYMMDIATRLEILEEKVG